MRNTRTLSYRPVYHYESHKDMRLTHFPSYFIARLQDCSASVDPGQSLAAVGTQCDKVGLACSLFQGRPPRKCTLFLYHTLFVSSTGRHNACRITMTFGIWLLFSLYRNQSWTLLANILTCRIKKTVMCSKNVFHMFQDFPYSLD